MNSFRAMKNTTKLTKTLFALLIPIILSSCGIHNTGKKSNLALVKNSYSKTTKTNEATAFTEKTDEKSESNIVEHDFVVNSESQMAPEVMTQSATYDLYDNTVASINEEGVSYTPSQRKMLDEIPCDKILLRSGDEISGKVLEIGTSEVKYKRCDNLEGPTISVYKKDVFMITYSNGIKDVFKEEVAVPERASSNELSEQELRRKKSFSITSMILGILATLSLIFVLYVPFFGFFFLPFSILAIIFGAIALYGKVNNKTSVGRRMAIAGFVLGIISFVTTVTVILLEEFDVY
jgi:hypothetical protein